MGLKTIDTEYEEYTLTRVRAYESGGWEISHDWMCFSCPADSPVEPKEGMVARFYGKGFGSPVRGLLIDGHRVFYRTPSEDAVYRDEQLYGKDAADLLSRWDDGKSVFTIEMGGLGPGYEQVIQIMTFEILRWFLATSPDKPALSSAGEWEKIRDRIESEVLDGSKIVRDLNPSGAQWGAAVQLAAQLYLHGPITVLKKCKDRHIQTSNNIRFAPTP